MNACPQRYLAPLLMALACSPLTVLAASEAPAPSAGFVRAPHKPNGSGVDVRYRVEGVPAVGRPTRVQLLLGQIRDPAGATVRLQAGGGLTLDATGAPATLAAGESASFSVTVTPQNEGLAYLSVFTTQNGATSSIAVPIQTGAAAAPSQKAGPGKLKETAAGEKILSMPVK